MVDDYLQISKLNDFIFCPYSIYLHNIYENFEESNYHETYQKSGKLSHDTIDNKTYTTEKNILQGLSVYSKKLGLAGKIDLFNKTTGELIERKHKIVNIYEGYYLQLYAQYFCLKEMGYKVKKLSLYSMEDNKKYNVDLPDKLKLEHLVGLVREMQDFDVNTFKGVTAAKCEKCIYNVLCPYSKC